MNAHAPSSASHPVNSHVVLIVGIVLIAVPLLIRIFAHEAYGDVQQFLRIITALGGGLIGSFIPGLLKVRFPGVEALGGMAVFALILMYDPLWKVDAALERVERSSTSPSTSLPHDPDTGPGIAPVKVPDVSPSLAACLRDRLAEYQQPKTKTTTGGARAPSPGLGGGTRHAQSRICLSVGPNQQLISAETRNLVCHGGRCEVSAPTIDGPQVCVTARAWSESKSFGGGGSGKYELIAHYRDVATDDVTARLEAACRDTSTGRP